MSASKLAGGSIRILWDASDSADVTITTTADVASTSFTVNGGAVVFPYALSSSTTFETDHSGTYEVSVAHHGYEVANTPDGTREVRLEHGQEIIFAPTPDGTPNSKFMADLHGSLSATYARTDDEQADTAAGASIAAKITNAAAAARHGGSVIVPADQGVTPAVPEESDLTVAAGRVIEDRRYQKGTLSNLWQRGFRQLTAVFGANTAGTVVEGWDNGSVFAVDAVLSAGTGGNGNSGSIIHGENVGIYAGMTRTGGTRSGWGMNALARTSVAPSNTTQTIGLEVDIDNNSGVAATDDDAVDGVVILSGGSSAPRFALNIGSANATKWRRGIHIDGISDRALSIGAGSTKGIVCAPPADFLSSVFAGAGYKQGADARYLSDAEVGVHQWRTFVDGVEQQIAELTAHGQLTISNYIGGTPIVKAGGSATNANIAIKPKGAGVVDIQGPAKVGTYTTAGRPSASTVGAGATVYDTTLSKPIWSDGTTWRDAMGTAV